MLNMEKKEGRTNGYISHDDFSSDDYLSLYYDVKESGMDPWVHYVKYGKKEGRVKNIIRKMPFSSNEKDNLDIFIDNINMIKDISESEDSVAIACWEGCHNPIGRAKVLYDILENAGRPVVLFAFSMGSFGEKIWSPIDDGKSHIFIIPWSERNIYFNILNLFNITFKTVWISKNRLPSLILASNLSNNNTKFILDIDDFEELFYDNDNYNYIYSTISKNICNELTQNIHSKTVSSCTLKEKFGGLICRHARKKQNITLNRNTDNFFHICFAGTVRKHKDILGMIRIIHTFNTNNDLQIKLHIYGDIDEETLQTIKENKNITIENRLISREELYTIISSMDASITGGPEESTVSHYQISSKIGDALAAGIPVLVPDSPSVADIKDIDGIFIYDEDNFESIIYHISKAKKIYPMPYEFTLERGYEIFCNAEKAASNSDSMLSLRENNIQHKQQNLVLIWKQFDAGLYGRRIDQIARTYKYHNKNCRVIVLEIASHQVYVNLNSELLNMDSDANLKYSLLQKKYNTYIQNGVEYISIFYENDDINKEFVKFIHNNELSVLNTCMIIFPIIPDQRILKIVSMYHTIADIVDNNLMWDKEKYDIKSQYYKEVFSLSSLNIFNSKYNMDYFNKLFLSDRQDKSVLIQNWYTWYKEYSPKKHDCINIIYSGNMNDRIDWDLFIKTAEVFKNSKIHIVGVANNSQSDLYKILKYNNVIYYGPLNEERLIRLIEYCDILIIPHKNDDISYYMNPLKVMMYDFFNIPVVSTDVNGIYNSNNIYIAKKS